MNDQLTTAIDRYNDHLENCHLRGIGHDGACINGGRYMRDIVKIAEQNRSE